MSIKVMSRVWELSAHKGSDLLLLLAIADNANDDGVCWPGMAYLAEKVRMSERSIINIVRRLEQSGEIVVKHVRNSGNRYAILTGMTPEQRAKVIANFLSENISLIEDNCKTEPTKVKDFHLISETAIAVEPSRTTNEPSLRQNKKRSVGNRKAKPSQTPLPDMPQPEPHANARDHFLALSEICKVVLAVATEQQKRQLGQSSKLLREKANATPESIRNFGAWWYAEDWRGKQGQPPTPAQVRSEWGRFLAGRSSGNVKPPAAEPVPVGEYVDPSEFFGGHNGKANS